MKNFPFLLERLHDAHPKSQIDPDFSEEEKINQLVFAIKSDLERLINARLAWTVLPSRCPDLQKSVLCYGLRDIKSYTLSNKDELENIRRNLEILVSTFEPRLKEVRVGLMPHDAPITSHLPLTVEAVLCTPYPDECVYFDINLKVSEM